MKFLQNLYEKDDPVSLNQRNLQLLPTEIFNVENNIVPDA